MKGRVYWLTGLAGAGKSTIAAALREELRKDGVSAILIDGDIVRGLLGNYGEGYAREDRLELGMFYARLCHMLSSQGFTIICATISLFHDIHKWNRKNMSDYLEVLVLAPHGILLERNHKELYSTADVDKAKQIVGVDIEPEIPERPDLELINDGTVSIENLASRIYQLRSETYK